MQPHLSIFDFQFGETVASIGCGDALWETAYGISCGGLNFDLVENHPDALTVTGVAESVAFWEKQLQTHCTSRFQIFTELPNVQNYYDKILIINALHEIAQPEELLHRVGFSLKKTGFLFVEEALASTPGQCHEGCGLPLFTEESLYLLLKKMGFVLKTQSEVSDEARIFCFGKITL